MNQSGAAKLLLEELARRTGEPPEQLLEWRALRLIGADDQAEFALEDVERVRLVQLCRRRGISAETIARAEEAESGFLRRYFDRIFPMGIEPPLSLAEAAELTGLDAVLVRRLLETTGLLDASEAIYSDDIEALRGWNVALTAGLPEEALLPLVRVYADALGRVAEAEARLFHFYVHERLKEAGVSGRDLVETSEAASGQMRQLIEPALLYFHRKGMATALREDLLLHLGEYAGRVVESEAPAQLRLAIVFLDLASFTPLTESMGDVAAAEIVARFSELVREAVNRHRGRVVERIGDAFMLTFVEVPAAVQCALEIEKRTTTEPQFPAVRGGIHVGPVLYREGGYVGANVNLASRVAAEAQRRQIFVTAEVRKEASALPDVDFVPIGRRQLKGLTDEIELFEVRHRTATRVERVVDPVCGMELTRAGVAATLSIGAEELSFCSENCLRKFVESRE